MTAIIFVICIASVVIIYEKMIVYPIKYREYIKVEAEKNEIEESVIFSIIKIESNFDKKAESKVGAKGLMQIMDKTADYISKVQKIEEYDIYDEKTNIKFGCWYFGYLTKKFDKMETAVVAYNAGENKVSKWLGDKRYSDDGKTLKEIPYNESKMYLKKFCKTLKKYKKLYGNILDKG